MEAGGGRLRPSFPARLTKQFCSSSFRVASLLESTFLSPFFPSSLLLPMPFLPHLFEIFSSSGIFCREQNDGGKDIHLLALIHKTLLGWHFINKVGPFRWAFREPLRCFRKFQPFLTQLEGLGLHLLLFQGSYISF